MTSGATPASPGQCCPPLEIFNSAMYCSSHRSPGSFTLAVEDTDTSNTTLSQRLD